MIQSFQYPRAFPAHSVPVAVVVFSSSGPSGSRDPYGGIKGSFQVTHIGILLYYDQEPTIAGHERKLPG